MKLSIDFEPWDFEFNLEIEREMFQKQAEYFSSSDIAINDNHRAEIAQLLVKLLDIVIGNDLKREVIEDTMHFVECGPNLKELKGNIIYKDTVYINTKNANRFLNQPTIELFTKNPDLGWHDLRQTKAWYLYNKLRYYKMQDLWN